MLTYRSAKGILEEKRRQAAQGASDQPRVRPTVNLRGVRTWMEAVIRSLADVRHRIVAKAWR